VVELLLSRLPQESLQNLFAVKLSQILKAKKKKGSRKYADSQANQGQPTIKQQNESIINTLKTITRQGSQAGGNSRNSNLSAKKLI